MSSKFWVRISQQMVMMLYPTDTDGVHRTKGTLLHANRTQCNGTESSLAHPSFGCLLLYTHGDDGSRHSLRTCM
jgi:hypothetical protein